MPFGAHAGVDQDLRHGVPRGCRFFPLPGFSQRFDIVGRMIVRDVLNAMYSLNLSREEVINIGKTIIMTELDFNEKAGILKDKSEIPEFLRIEASIPTGLKFTFTEEELNQFWEK